MEVQPNRCASPATINNTQNSSLFSRAVSTMNRAIAFIKHLGTSLRIQERLQYCKQAFINKWHGSDPCQGKQIYEQIRDLNETIAENHQTLEQMIKDFSNKTSEQFDQLVKNNSSVFPSPIRTKSADKQTQTHKTISIDTPPPPKKHTTFNIVSTSTTRSTPNLNMPPDIRQSTPNLSLSTLPRRTSTTSDIW